MTRLHRRGLLIGAGALLVGCSADPSTHGTSMPRQSTTSDAATPTARTTPAPPTPWTPHPNEVRPEVKIAAARVVERLGGTGRARIVYPQYGGLLESAASVMVVAEVPATTVIDVRLARRGDRWTVTDLRRARRPDRAAPAPDRPTASLLANPRVALPGPAVADLEAGAVDPRIVALLDRLSADFRVSVSVLRSGHPWFVYGTRTTSNHSRGRAVDVWAIDRTPIVSMAPDDRRLHRFITSARSLGATEIGAPVDPDGSGATHFTDDLHRDHVHLGFDSA